MKKPNIRRSVISFYAFIIVLFLAGTILGNQTVTVISEMVPTPRKHRIVIDAGHGGEDGGAVSCTGKNESNINLQIALRLNDLLHLLGHDTVMVRSSDTAVYTSGDSIAQKKISDLRQRVNIVEHTPNAVLVSIHQNMYSESKYYGPQVFYANSKHSEELAKLLQQNLTESLNPGSSRQAKQGSGIFLLEKIHQPGVIIECGFLSNPREESLLSSGAYQKKLCCVIGTSFSRFLEDT